MAIDQTTVFSLLGTLAVLGTAYALSLRLLPPHSARKPRALFVWHVFDALIHAIFEGSFLWNCFCVHAPASASGSWSGSSAYGAAHGTGPFSRLWQEYARADRRWAGADPTIVALEILTVSVGTPLALACAALVCRAEWQRRGDDRRENNNNNNTNTNHKMWFWMVVLATGELYGGWMTFVPEWLSGSPNLDTSNFLYKWVYLFFFNTVWVWIPLWILVEAYKGITGGTPTKGGRIKEL